VIENWCMCVLRNDCVVSSDVIFHAALDGLPPLVERCTVFLEYVNDGKCGML